MSDKVVESILVETTTIFNATITSAIEIATTLSTITPTPTSTPKDPEEDYNKHPYVDKASHINTLVTPFILYFVTGMVLFFGFCILRNYFKIFYMPRRRLKRCAPPRIPSGLFTWIMVVLRLKTSYVLPIVGVDAEVV
ncbi:hypothetical protein PIROE2DRAFT_58240 [Piromyces sp. E2]|nr:hypothetical protein PIROE2DRAFT_58240 [Piromyces sp. E2]|eukprot:OUM68167.1 hypothetical protein PIROE2DRAFT_58240 [Piromyces sp. E2]